MYAEAAEAILNKDCVIMYYKEGVASLLLLNLL